MSTNEIIALGAIHNNNDEITPLASKFSQIGGGHGLRCLMIDVVHNKTNADLVFGKTKMKKKLHL